MSSYSSGVTVSFCMENEVFVQSFGEDIALLWNGIFLQYCRSDYRGNSKSYIENQNEDDSVFQVCDEKRIYLPKGMEDASNHGSM